MRRSVGGGGNNGGNAAGRRPRRVRTTIAAVPATIDVAAARVPGSPAAFPGRTNAGNQPSVMAARPATVPGHENGRGRGFPDVLAAKIERPSISIAGRRSAGAKTVKPAGRTRSDLDRFAGQSDAERADGVTNRHRSPRTR